MMEELKKNRIKTASFLLILASIAIRIYILPIPNGDMTNFNLKWYQVLAENGIANTLATSFTNYSPPYTYLLALASLSKDFIPPLIAIKLIAILFDILGMYIVFQITKTKYPQGPIPLLGAAIYFSAPSVIINSSLWGQADSIYTCFLLLCLYFLLKDRPALAMAAFGLAFTVKAQALLLAPFLLVMILRNRISWKFTALPPLIYLLAILPVVLLGRDFADALFVYLNQAGSYNVLSANSPNFYIIFSKEFYDSVMPLGMMIATIAIPYWIYLSSYRAKSDIPSGSIVLLALISTAITPFLLPKMHDRYFYPADVFSIVLAFFLPELWFVPILYQAISIAATSIFLFNANEAFLLGAALLNAIVIAILLKFQRDHKLLYQHPFKKWTVALQQGIFIVLTPLVLLGVGVNLATSQIFYRAENKLFHTSAVATQPSPQQRILQFDRILYYLNNPVDTESLYAKSQATDGVSLSKHEAYYLQDIKKIWEPSMKIADISFLILYTISLLAWAGGTAASLRKGIRMGAWLTAFLGIAAGAFLMILRVFNVQLPFPFPPSGDLAMLPVLFPPGILLGALIFCLLFLTGSGILLGIMLRLKENS
jgi:Gpi18-like mannosyltransferase